MSLIPHPIHGYVPDPARATARLQTQRAGAGRILPAPRGSDRVSPGARVRIWLSGPARAETATAAPR